TLLHTCDDATVPVGDQNERHQRAFDDLLKDRLGVKRAQLGAARCCRSRITRYDGGKSAWITWAKSCVKARLDDRWAPPGSQIRIRCLNGTRHLETDTLRRARELQLVERAGHDFVFGPRNDRAYFCAVARQREHACVIRAEHD